MPDSRSISSFRAPGRVNLIGEHVDYTGGLVLPMAIPFYTTCELELIDEAQYRFVSAQFEETRTLAADETASRADDWTDYPIGVLLQLKALGVKPPPFQARISGNVPLNAGLSSSASLEVSTALALLRYSGVSLSPEEIALLCQRAENEFVGSPCGIMDQFVITASTAGHALLLNTRDLTYTLLPMNEGALGRCVVVIINSGVKHSVATGEYVVRRKEVEAGQAAVLSRFPHLRDLGDAAIEQLVACQKDMLHLSFLRCRHIVTENQRVREAGTAMQAGDPVRLGKLMTAAHASYRDDFDASVDEINFLVETALSLDGCYGARLTGGGFGGCVVALVEAENAEPFSRIIKDRYDRRYHLAAETWICEAVDGAIADADTTAGAHRA